MGNTYASLLILKKGRLPSIARGLSAALEAAERAPEALSLYIREGDRFYVLGGEIEDFALMEDIRTLADACARQLGASVLSVEEYDSDAAIFRVSDGQTASMLAFGLVEPEALRELETEPYQEALWRPLFSTKRGWTAFEKLREEQAHLPETLDSDGFEPFFAEYAIETLAEALKFDADAARGFAEEGDGEPVWRWPEEGKTAKKRIPWMPEDALPALVKSSCGSGELLHISFVSSGGKGRGIEAIILPHGITVDDYRIPEALLRCIENRSGQYACMLADTQIINTNQGRAWHVTFPDVEIPVGLCNAERFPYHQEVTCFFLFIPVYAMDKPLPYFRASDFGPPLEENAHLTDTKAEDWYEQMKRAEEKLPGFDIWVMPVENHPSSIHAHVKLYTSGENYVRDFYLPMREKALKNKETETQT